MSRPPQTPSPVPGRPRGRPPKLTLRAIADAALAVGFADLTLPTVAARLGVSHSALYRHVTDREGLVLAALDRALELTDWPDPAPSWRDDLRDQAWTLWRLLDRHPGVERELPSLTRYPDEVLTRFGRAVQRLAAHGFPSDEAFLAVDAVYDLTIAQFTLTRQLAPLRRTRDPTWPDHAGPAVAPLIHDALNAPPEQWFDRKLSLLLDGISHRLP